MIIFVLLTFILILYYFVDNNSNTSIFERFSNMTFYKCPKLVVGNAYHSAYDKYNIIRDNNPENSDIYVPCGYNFVENELAHLKPKRKDQKIYGINGCDNIVSKNGLWNLIESKYGRKHASQLMPETYILYKPEHMKLLKNNYDPNTIYLLKKNIQRKLGIELTRDLNNILSKQNSSFKVVQKYVDHLYLIKKRKVNLRIYLLITCKDGYVKSYIHKLGKCIYTNKDICSNNNINLDKEAHLTSFNLSSNVYDDRPETFEELKKYLGHYKYNILMNNIYSNLKQVIQSANGKLCKLVQLNKHMCFQLFGLDYIFDKNMHPYLLEMNKGPDMTFKSKNDPITKKKVLEDVLITSTVVKSKDKSLFKLI